MTRHPARRQPIINSTGARRLAAQISSLRRRQPTLNYTIQAIRSGNERVLHDLVVRAQRGDSDAAVTAIWALLPASPPSSSTGSQYKNGTKASTAT